MPRKKNPKVTKVRIEQPDGTVREWFLTGDAVKISASEESIYITTGELALTPIAGPLHIPVGGESYPAPMPMPLARRDGASDYVRDVDVPARYTGLGPRPADFDESELGLPGRKPRDAQDEALAGTGLSVESLAAGIGL
jgi:hypothetical protein